MKTEAGGKSEMCWCAYEYIHEGLHRRKEKTGRKEGEEEGESGNKPMKKKKSVFEKANVCLCPDENVDNQCLSHTIRGCKKKKKRVK